ncbi:alpha-1 3-mannosyltransferase [Fusarium beomiforme]|uniref:Alpha-1 3-mannosyltransferase n=1 Tax=Fusarium beomiforme TaxID=44412 RepID=A0A9P5AGV1_9HYPO|nr:alpha-1 3-mannosyltransferase [Fusarium beomiforme]
MSLFDGLVASVEESTSPTPLTETSLPTPIIANGTILSAERISPYISAIFNSSSTAVPRLKCPALNTNRYRILEEQHHDQDAQDSHIDYFFALNLRICIGILPRLIGSIVEAINPAQGNARIRKLAQLRNLVLAPLYKEQVNVADDTAVLFINDVSAFTEDILELALQRRSLNADIACAMDWTYVGADPTFYDIWIARTISGDSFFEVGSDGNWNSAWNLFWNAPDTCVRYDGQQPFQVFACWNGATAFTAAPLLHGLQFRDTRKGECFQGEPQLFCKDMWSRGFRKIAVVSNVNLEYSDEKAADIKKLKGYVSDVVEGQEEDGTIEWVFEPPEKVRCMPTWEEQSWRPWNETL